MSAANYWNSGPEPDRSGRPANRIRTHSALGRDRSPDYVFSSSPIGSGALAPRSPTANMYNSLQVPGAAGPLTHQRPRSMPPPRGRSRSRRRQSGDSHRHRSRSRSSSRSSRSSTIVEKAKDFVDDNFSQSKTGIGLGLLGAVVGGLAAHQVAGRADKKYGSGSGSGSGSHNRRKSKEEEAEIQRAKMASALVGAVVGGLGANALKKRIEDNNEKKAGELRREKSRNDSGSDSDDGWRRGERRGEGRRRRSFGLLG